uniref:Uncharacterized protein n=1 Tax=Rangifer tarandus platyrhynchus TaxID=3082113 RepID=A0ACB0EX92_RANTA|nr:unnamed protein product [Rangifer tarandus platyrhynchus]
MRPRPRPRNRKWSGAPGTAGAAEAGQCRAGPDRPQSAVSELGLRRAGERAGSSAEVPGRSHVPKREGSGGRGGLAAFPLAVSRAGGARARLPRAGGRAPGPHLRGDVAIRSVEMQRPARRQSGAALDWEQSLLWVRAGSHLEGSHSGASLVPLQRVWGEGTGLPSCGSWPRRARGSGVRNPLPAGRSSEASRASAPLGSAEIWPPELRGGLTRCGRPRDSPRRPAGRHWAGPDGG